MWSFTVQQGIQETSTRLGIGGEQRPTLMLSVRSRESLRLTPETVLTCCEALIINGSNHPWLTTAQCLKRPIGLFLDSSLRKTRIDAAVCQISSQHTCKELELQHFSIIAAIIHDQRSSLVARFQDVPACLQQTRFLCRIANDYDALGVITKYDERTVETVLQHARGPVTVETPHPERERELLALASQLKDIGGSWSRSEREVSDCAASGCHAHSSAQHDPLAFVRTRRLGSSAGGSSGSLLTNG
jgi:hypothetical protein